ncbi:MAG: hypothetical protein LBF50_05690, partial [Azoarcus sp.]|nr:hypothetical protein [Azoarcus sp.]
ILTQIIFVFKSASREFCVLLATHRRRAESQGGPPEPEEGFVSSEARRCWIEKGEKGTKRPSTPTAKKTASLRFGWLELDCHVATLLAMTRWGAFAMTRWGRLSQ